MDAIITQIGSKQLYEHQKVAVHWMMQRENDAFDCGGFIFDEMGLGKTVTTIGLLQNSPVPRTLILCPLAVLRQWRTALADTGYGIWQVTDGKWSRFGGKITGPRVQIANQDKVVANPLLFTTMTFQRLVCDEAHTLRNHNGKKQKALEAMNFERKWFLTGTPIVNGPEDMVSLLHLLNPERPLFSQSILQLQAIIGNLALGRSIEILKEQIAHLLPQKPVIEQRKLKFSTEEEGNFYRGIQGRLNAQLQALMDAGEVNTPMFLELLLRLRQISTHPQVQIQGKRRSMGDAYRRADWGIHSTKTNEICKILSEEKEKRGFVIFCNFTDEIEILKQILSKHDSVENVFVQKGDMTADQRQDVIEQTERAMEREQFKTCEPYLPKNIPMDVINQIIDPMIGQQRHVVLLAQIHCAGTGLNLQHMDRCIFTTPWWTAAMMDQAVGRVVRIGQKKATKVWHLHLEEEADVSLNIDEQISERVDYKRAMCEAVLLAADHRF